MGTSVDSGVTKVLGVRGLGTEGKLGMEGEGGAGDQATPPDRGRGEAVFCTTMVEAMGRGDGARMALFLGVDSSTGNEEDVVSIPSAVLVSERERKCFRNPWEVRGHREGRLCLGQSQSHILLNYLSPFPISDLRQNLKSEA